MQLRNKAVEASRLEQSGFDFGGKSINEHHLKTSMQTQREPRPLWPADLLGNGEY